MPTGSGLEGFAEAREAALATLEPEEPEVEEDPEDQETPEPEGGSDTDGTPDGDQEPEPGAEEATAEVPESYMGVDLSGLEPERALALIEDLKGTDKYLQRLQREKKELEDKLAAGETPQDNPQLEPEPEAELTDEQILERFGYKPDDPMYEVAQEMALPLAKQVLGLSQAVEQMSLQNQVEQFIEYFHTSLDEAEKKFGELPPEVTRDDVLDYMDENGIANPVDAYHRMTAEPRKFLQDKVSEEKRLAEERKQEAKRRIKGTRPGNRENSDEPKDLPKNMTPREAALAAMKELNVDPKKVDMSKMSWAGRT